MFLSSKFRGLKNKPLVVVLQWTLSREGFFCVIPNFETRPYVVQKMKDYLKKEWIMSVKSLKKALIILGFLEGSTIQVVYPGKFTFG